MIQIISFEIIIFKKLLHSLRRDGKQSRNRSIINKRVHQRIPKILGSEYFIINIRRRTQIQSMI